MDTATSKHAKPGQMVSKPTLLLKPMPLKNTLESGVIENHASATCCGLGKRGETVYYTRNPYLVAKTQNAEVIDLSKYNGRFLQVRGTNKKIQQLRKDAQFMFLKHKRMKKGLPVISFENQRNWLGLQKSIKVIFYKLMVLQLSTNKAVAN